MRRGTVASAPVTLFDEEEIGAAPGDPLPPGPTSRVRLVVAYDGGPFHGFEVNAGVPTVGGRLTDALTTLPSPDRPLLDSDTLLVAGRTEDLGKVEGGG